MERGKGVPVLKARIERLEKLAKGLAAEVLEEQSRGESGAAVNRVLCEAGKRLGIGNDAALQQAVLAYTDC